MTPTLDDHQKAFTEISFLLHIFAATVDELMGGATAPVGRIAGRRAARKLPLHLGKRAVPTAFGYRFQSLQRLRFIPGFGLRQVRRQEGLVAPLDLLAQRVPIL